MNRSIIGIIVFCVFLSGNAASSNVFFLDSISIPGAKCKISIPDSNSFFSSYKHPCNKYYFFQYNKYYQFSTPIVIDFSSSVICTLFAIQFSLWQLASNKTDTLPIPCDSLHKFGLGGTNTITTATGKINTDWVYSLPVKRLATTTPLYGDLLHFVLKSASDSNDIYFSRTVLHFQNVKTPACKTVNNFKFIQKAYTINGELIQTKHRLPSVYILKDNATAHSMIHLNKF